MNYSIRTIADASIPPQVLQSIVSWIAVGEVATFHSFRTRTNKSQENQSVYEEKFLRFSAMTDKTNTVAASFLENWLHNTGFVNLFDYTSPTSAFYTNSLEDFNSTPATDSIQPLVTGDVPPVFFATVRMDLNALVEKMSTGVTSSHCPLPKKDFPSMKRWAGGRETALRVYSPSPR